jgi:hypothetical protein
MKVWAVLIKTDSCDEYNYVYDYKPTRAEVIERVWQDEGEIESLDWYLETTNVSISETEIGVEL